MVYLPRPRFIDMGNVGKYTSPMDPLWNEVPQVRHRLLN